MNAYMLYYATGVIMIPVLLFSFYCQIKVKRAFRGTAACTPCAA